MTQTEDKAATMRLVRGVPWAEPYAGAIRPLTTQEYAALRTDVAQRGIVVPLVIDEDGNVLDGHHRLRAARDEGLQVVPVDVRGGLSEQDKEALAHDLNDHRRHLSVEEQRQRAAERRARVARRREEGHSLRRIAEEEGVTHIQVRDDLGGGVNRLTPPPSDGSAPPPERAVGGHGCGETPPPQPQPQLAPVAPRTEGAGDAPIMGRDGRVQRPRRVGIGARILDEAARHPEWSAAQLGQELDVDKSYVKFVLRVERERAGGQPRAVRPPRAPSSSSRTIDERAMQRATVAQFMARLRWGALEGLLEYAVSEGMSAKALLRLCRECRRPAAPEASASAEGSSAAAPPGEQERTGS